MENADWKFLQSEIRIPQSAIFLFFLFFIPVRMQRVVGIEEEVAEAERRRVAAPPKKPTPANKQKLNAVDLARSLAARSLRCSVSLAHVISSAARP